MHKLKLTVALPTVQVIAAAMLLRLAGPPDFYVPTTKLICQGLNAPALVTKFFGLVPGLFSLVMDRRILGFGADDLFFLLGVAVTWYFVGRTLDRRFAPKKDRAPALTVSIMVHCFLLALGVLLLCFGLSDFQHPNFDNLGHRPMRAVLVLAWSASLIFFSVRGLVRAIRPATAGPG